MCGIFGYVGERTDTAELVVRGLATLEYRGYDSWGIAVAHGDRIFVDKRVGKVRGVAATLPASAQGIGHTRWATHGGVTNDNAHPHIDCTGRIAVVHNGIIENEAVLRRTLAHHPLRSETDTELIAHLIEERLAAGTSKRGAFETAVIEAFRMLQGLNAIAVLDAVTGTLVAAKTGSPLVVGFADTGNFVASDAEALLEHTRRVAFLDDGEAVVFTGTEARRRSLATGGDRPFEVTILDRAASSTDCGAFPDYMTKEIHEQPDVLARLALDASGAQELAKAIRDSEDVFAIGCGSGYHAALAAQYLFARSGKRVTAVLASEFGHVESFVRPGSLVIALSQSGETADVLTATRAARERGARVVAVTNAPGSSLSRAAGVVVPLGAGTERCVVSTKAFSAKLAVLLLAAHALGSDLQEGRRRVAAVAEELRAFLVGPAREAVRTIAGALVHRNHLFVIGRGTSYPLALEVALKIKEVSYLHAEAFAGGELKHGVIALIERGTPCIVLAPNDETRTDVLSAASQVRARGATVIGIACEPHATFDHFLPIGDFADATALVSSVPAQLLGYDLARLRGHDPDMPRNLAKSVTVR